MKTRIRRFLKSLTDTLFPRFCCVCGKRLLGGEEHTCCSCLLNLPKTHFKGKKNNVIERLLWDDAIYTQRANSFMYYHQKSPYNNIFFHFKYFNHPHIAVAYGRIMAEDLAGTDFFSGIDCIVPVPLSRKRFRQRGYNQSERLAQGISQVTGLPIDTTSVARTVNNPTQTHLTGSARWRNVENVFCLHHPEKLHGKHVLIVDDMITSGSTVRACAHALLQAGEVRISFISLGTSHRNRRRIFADERFEAELDEPFGNGF